MTDNLGNVLEELRNCVNLACGHKGPLKAASRIIKMLEVDLKSSINQYSEAEKGNKDKAISEIETALTAAKNAASAIRSYLKAEMEFRNRNKGGNSGIEPTGQSSLGGYKTAGRKDDAIQTHIEALIIQKQTTNRSNSETELQLFEVGTYKDLRSCPSEGKEIDHIPSKAALCEAACRYMEVTTGVPPDDDEQKKIQKVMEQHGGAIVVPKEMHRRHSRTIGGRNTSEQITNDSLDPVGAIIKDLDYYMDLFKQYGLDTTAINVLKTRLVKQLTAFPEEIWKRN